MSRSSSSAIEVVGARTHNLKGIDCRIPHGKVTVVTGPSGAGKSSLAFDTVFAEGQRRFVESMSTYVQQFLDPMERPPVDALNGVLPAVALEAHNSVRSARATVGTLTEVHDVLRLLFTHLAELDCTNGHGPMRRITPQEAVDELERGEVGERFLLVAELERPRKSADLVLRELVRQGYRRRLDGGSELIELDPEKGWSARLDPLRLVLGRFQSSGASSRLAEAIEEGLGLRHARLIAQGNGERRFYGAGLVCPQCGETGSAPTPSLFSFNSPLGACPECQGFGRVIGIDAGRVIPDPTRTLAQSPIAPWNTPAYDELYDRLYSACRERGVPTDVPWKDLPEEARRWIWDGDGGAASEATGVPAGRKARRKRRSAVAAEGFVSIRRFFAWLEKRSYKVHVRVLLARYRSYDPCPACGGTRFRPDTLRFRLHGLPLPELTARSIEELRRWLAAERFENGERGRGGELLTQLERRLEVLHRVGLDYLTLDRQARTLSGGEIQRIYLAAALGSGLTSTLYVLDEPTVGLHPQDSARLLELLKEMAGGGNTVLVVEHDRTLIQGADHLIDLGPRAGEQGGEVVAEGPPKNVLRNRRSLTARYLRPPRPTVARRHRDQRRRERGRPTVAEELVHGPQIEILGARAHNLRSLDVRFPARALVAVTGVSGSGKSTLIENVLYGNYQRDRGVVDVEPGPCDELRGVDGLEDVTLVDQRPLGRSRRSNPVTYVKAYGEIRRLYAETEQARRRKITPGHFSFNVDKGRCPECAGTGAIEVDMQFLAPVTVTCDACHGRRFKPEVLEIRYRGRTIAETLDLTIDEALEIYADHRRVSRPLETLRAVGLGYLRLGQSTSTLSGGEAQRLKLAAFLDRPKRGRPRLFLFDEPTTGLHLADIDTLYKALRKLVVRGDGVVVVEHNLDLVARCDWILELGPGGGTHGGRLLFNGPLEDFLENGDGPTAEALRDHQKT
ncbi:MAG: excinuclease ABC subunit UvrA [Thermoanaerobaculia bacterium]